MLFISAEFQGSRATQKKFIAIVYKYLKKVI